MVDKAGAVSVSTTRVLADIADVLESSVGVEPRIRQVLRMLNQVVPYDVCGLLERRQAHERFVAVPAAPEDETVREALLDLLAELNEQTARPAIIQNTGLPWPSHVAIPLIGLDEVIGVLFVAGLDEDRYSSSDISPLAVVAAQLASYLTNVSLAERAALDRGKLDDELVRSNALFRAEKDARTQAETAIRLRDEFLASVSHDLRTPLTAIKGRAQLLRRSMVRGAVDSQRILDDLEGIMEGVSRMALQIDDLFAVARERIEQGLALNLESTDLVALVRHSVEELAPLYEGKILFEPAVPRLIGEWDGGRLSRVCDNLLSNAVKYSPGQTPVRVTLARQDVEVPGALLQVVDHGIGIPDGDLGRIFEPFHRAANSGAFAGTGLGLAGSKASVEQHGGTLSVMSQEGRGATFRVWLPLHPQNE